MRVIQIPDQNDGDQKIEDKPGKQLKEIRWVDHVKSEKLYRINSLVCYSDKSRYLIRIK
jgi:hypothetical protein